MTQGDWDALNLKLRDRREAERLAAQGTPEYLLVLDRDEATLLASVEAANGVLEIRDLIASPPEGNGPLLELLKAVARVPALLEMLSERITAQQDQITQLREEQTLLRAELATFSASQKVLATAINDLRLRLPPR